MGEPDMPHDFGSYTVADVRFNLVEYKIDNLLFHTTQFRTVLLESQDYGTEEDFRTLMAVTGDFALLRAIVGGSEVKNPRRHIGWWQCAGYQPGADSQPGVFSKIRADTRGSLAKWNVLYNELPEASGLIKGDWRTVIAQSEFLCLMLGVKYVA